jgi:hypothetical protein
VQAVPRLGKLYPGICLTAEEKAQENLSAASKRCSSLFFSTQASLPNFNAALADINMIYETQNLLSL